MFLSAPMTRRLMIGGGVACVAGTGLLKASMPGGASVPAPSLRGAASFPVGCCLSTASLGDPAYMQNFLHEFSQITPEWEMKMGPMLGRDGRLHTGAMDRLIAYARKNGLSVHGTTLVWYKNPPPYFVGLKHDKEAFKAAYRRYILNVTEHFRDSVRGWDVVNEPMTNDGQLRPSLWSEVLGQENHIVRAFAHVAEGAPKAVAFLNEYDLERKPAKRRGFLKLVERMLGQGVKIGGLGTQSHIDIDTDPKQIKLAIRELAQFGLPIHVSELDISTARGKLDMRSAGDKLAKQAELAGVLADAFMALPERQRYAFTLWGMRDTDSWLMKPPMKDIRGGLESPLAFGADGRPKPFAAALSNSFGKKSG